MEEHGAYDGQRKSVLDGAVTVRVREGIGLLLWIRRRSVAAAHLRGLSSAGARSFSYLSNKGKPMEFVHWYEKGELRSAFEWLAQGPS
ncbi:DUF6461 domain-containing protein [Streptomyces sp. NPDC006463]|uniref:DUF6461 domain-containing protein n=1 Tax=Streptomyces sp. NPDC006463 TaxID=3364746 RepID=UPI0036A17149